MTKCHPAKQKKIKMLILCQNQFGYHVDSFSYCKYLGSNYEITYLCWDYSRKKVSLDNINVRYVSRNGTKLIRNLDYIKQSIRCIEDVKPDICIIKYFRGCSVLRLKYRKDPVFVFDVRTGSVQPKFVSRFIYNTILRFEALFFDNLTVISAGLRKQLRLDQKAHILPLGSECISSHIKQFHRLDLLYVGTLSYRHLEQTIEGFGDFLTKYKGDQVGCSYTIIGDGHHGELARLRELVVRLGLNKKVQLLGRIPFSELEPFFTEHNVGISYVPMKKWFDCQPVTKTFDYFLSGIPVIGTATSENEKVIDRTNGVLISDNRRGFFLGLEEFYLRRLSFDSRMIRESSSKYQWEYIVREFDNYLQKLVGEKDEMTELN